MARYLDEDAVWRCAKHPLKRRGPGVCPVCLRDRLVSLCPECAKVRPCGCSLPAITTSSSSSFYLFSSSSAGNSARAVPIERVSYLIDNEPAIQRSRSLANPLFRSRSRFSEEEEIPHLDRRGLARENKSKSFAFWSVFKSSKSKRHDDEIAENVKIKQGNDLIVDDYTNLIMMRSKSVGLTVTSNPSTGGIRSLSFVKGKRWHFRSPITAFRQPKSSKIIQERSPLYRG